MINIDSKNFEEEVISYPNLAIVDFWSPHCGPCRMIVPNLDKIEKANEDVKVCKINVDENGQLSVNFGVESIPTLLFFKNGDVVDKLVGLQSVAAIQSKIDLHKSSL